MEMGGNCFKILEFGGNTIKGWRVLNKIVEQYLQLKL